MQHHHLSKSHIIITVLAILAIIGIFLYRVYKSPTPSVSVVETPTETPASTQWGSQEIKSETLNESNQYYTITAEYPVTKDPGIAATLKAFASDAVAQFKDDVAWVMDPGAGASASDGSLSLDISYREQKTSALETYIFSITTYTGGAHGLQVTKTFTYNKDSKAIGVLDLFSNGQKGLDTVATFVQGEITKKKISDAAWIKDGAAPTVDNYKNFVVGDDGITFIFDAYQVAPYAAGIQNILVPTSVFASFANKALF